jgi:hypothetical protein
LYGFPREPEATDVETAEPRVPPQRVTSAPVAVPAAPADPYRATDPPFAIAEQQTTFAPPPYEPVQPESTYANSYGAADEGYGAASDSYGAAGNGYGAAATSYAAASDRYAAPSPLNGGPAGSEQPSTASAGATSLAAAGVWQTSIDESAWSYGGQVVEPASAAADVASAPAAVPPVAAAAATTAPAPSTIVPELIPIPNGEPEIPPWDRKPLMVVIAAAAVLLVIAIISGFISAAVLMPNPPVASWRAVGSAPTEQPTTQPPAAPPPAASETITLSGVGDVIMGSANLGLPPNNGAGFFDPVKEALASDLVMGNLETPLSEPTGYVKCGDPASGGCFQFSLPPSYANHLRAGGFQLLSIANNHTNDMGPQGLQSTKDALTAAGLQYTGGVDQITYVTVKGVKVAVLGFSVYSWGANLNNIPRAVELVRTAEQEADLVVIQMQGGAEGSDKTRVRPGHEFFLGEDRGDLIAFSHAVVDAGADVIFGHGPHIMRGMEFYKGRLIAYSLGNFCGYRALGSAGYLGVGGVLKVTLNKDGSWAGGTLVATEMVNGGMVAVDSDKRALPFVDGLSKADFGANAAVISTTDGTISPPV